MVNGPFDGVNVCLVEMNLLESMSRIAPLSGSGIHMYNSPRDRIYGNPDIVIDEPNLGRRDSLL